MGEDKGKKFTYQSGDGQHNYKVGWDSGKGKYVYISRDEQKDAREGQNTHDKPIQIEKKPHPPKKKQIRKPSPIPLICVAAMWLGRAFTGGLDSFSGIIKCAILSAVAFGVLRLFFPDKLVDSSASDRTSANIRAMRSFSLRWTYISPSPVSSHARDTLNSRQMSEIVRSLGTFEPEQIAETNG